MVTVDQVGEMVDSLISDGSLLEQLREAVAAMEAMHATENTLARLDSNPHTGVSAHNIWVTEVEHAQDEADVHIYTLVRSLFNVIAEKDLRAQADLMAEAFA